MVSDIILCSHRLRKITGSFAFIEHRFIRDGFWASLTHHALLLYVFLVMVGDRKGISFYSYDKICTVLRICVDDYVLARNELIDKDLIAFDGQIFQVLSLPERAITPLRKPLNSDELDQKDPATIGQLIRASLSKV